MLLFLPFSRCLLLRPAREAGRRAFRFGCGSKPTSPSWEKRILFAIAKKVCMLGHENVNLITRPRYLPEDPNTPSLPKKQEENIVCGSGPRM